MALSPTQRSLKKLRDEGWTPAIVERWNPHVRCRQDLYGFADLVAMKPGEPFLFVQATSGANLAARRTKILAEPNARLAIASGHRIVLHSWRQLKVKRGGKARYWACKEEIVNDDPLIDDDDTAEIARTPSAPPASGEAAPAGAPATKGERTDAPPAGTRVVGPRPRA